MSAGTIEREGKAAIVINAPTDPELLRLWNLALVKVQARDGKLPDTKTGWQVVFDDYRALTTKASGSISQVIREVCAKVPGGD